MAELTEQEKQCLAEMKAEKITSEHIKRAQDFVESTPYTHMSLMAIAAVCREHFEHEELAKLLEETADKVAELECRVI